MPTPPPRSPPSAAAPTLLAPTVEAVKENLTLAAAAELQRTAAAATAAARLSRTTKGEKIFRLEAMVVAAVVAVVAPLFTEVQVATFELAPEITAMKI